MSARDVQFYLQDKASALQIPDVRVAMQALKLQGVDARGLGIRSRDDAIKIIIENLDKGVKGNPVPQREPPRGLKKALEDDRANKAKLVSKFDAVHNFYKDLPSSYKKDLEQVFPNVEAEFTIRKNEILQNECTILIAGETASGKSSLINLLLGEKNLLPVSQLGCTSVVCEIRTSSDRKEAICYHRSEDGRKGKKAPPKILDLSSDKGIKSLHEAIADNDENGDSKYDRIEITYPVPMLEEGIVIVDTPGIGGSANMAKFAERYLSKSYGFIYVINSANAGGVQKGRLQNFMRMVVNAAGEEGYNSESSLFICNRWDMIPDCDKEAVKQDTFEKLSRYYPELRRSQLHYVSITEIGKALEFNTVTPECSKLFDLVEKLMPDSLRSRLNTNYRWLTAVLKRCIYSLKVSKVMQAKSMEKVKEEYAQVKGQIERLEHNSKDSIAYLKASISQESENVVLLAQEALKSRKMAERLFSWSINDCPTDDKKKVVAEALERISNRVAVEMNVWERENNIVIGIKDKIIRVCKRDFELMEGQIAKLEGALLDGDSKIVQDLHKSIKKQAPVKQLWKKAKEGSIDEETGSYKGLGGAIASVSPLKPGDKGLKKIFDGYKLKDSAKAISRMQDATKYFLDSIFESKNFKEKVHTFFKRFIKGIDAVAQMIPTFLKADVQLINILREQMEDTEVNLKEILPRLIYTSHHLLGQLDLFYVNYIMMFDYSINEISWNAQDIPVGSGSFADVFIADITTSKRKVPVALKVCRDPLKESTVTDILLEDRTLRELDHPNIVKYYGATYRFRDDKKKKDMQWIMILEVCKYTLKQKFVNPDVNNPGKLPTGTESQTNSMLIMADFVLQLCKGLQYIHEKGFVHRDLKLENILVTEKNQVKLTDVGLTKSQTDIAFTKVGSPVYMAPEVLLATQNCDHKADIYGLAVVLWEMWYGQDAAEYIQEHLFGTLENAIKDGLRPSLKQNTKPPQSWIDLIEASWHYEPEVRPSVDIHIKFFETFIKEFKRR